MIRYLSRLTRHKEFFLVVLVLLWTAYNLFSLLGTGFISDDAYNSQIKGLVIQQGTTINTAIWNEVWGWLSGTGRFLVVSWYMTYGLYYFTQDPLIVKTIAVAIILLDVLLFYWLVRRESGSSRIAILVALFLPIFFQFRLWHDPFLAFTFLMPVCLGLTTGALLAFQRYMDLKKANLLALSAVLFLVGLLTYEITIPFCALFMGLAVVRTKKFWKSVQLSLPFTVPALAVMLISAGILWFHSISSAKVNYTGSQLHLDLSALFPAFLIQTSATFPLTYFFNSKDHLDLLFRWRDLAAMILYGVLVGALLVGIRKSVFKTSLQSSLGFWLVGVFFFLVPSAVSSLSGHQVEINSVGYGFGYITIFFQYFGLCSILVGLLVLLLGRLKGPWLLVAVAILSSGGAVVAGINLGLNRAVAMKTNEFYKYPRELLQAALHAGIANEAPPGSTLFRSMRFPSDHYLLYNIEVGKILDIKELSDRKILPDFVLGLRHASVSPQGNVSSNGIEEIDVGDKNIYMLGYNFDHLAGKRGRVFFAKIDQFVFNNQTRVVLQANTNEVKLYDLEAKSISAMGSDHARIDFLKLIATEGADISEIRGANVVKLGPEMVSMDWSGSIGGLEGSSESNVRWASGNSVLRLQNVTSNPQPVTLSMGLQTPGAAKGSHVYITVNGIRTAVDTNPQTTVFSRQMILGPGSTKVEFSSDAPVVQVKGDPRKFVYGVFNLKVDAVTRELQKKEGNQ